MKISILGRGDSMLSMASAICRSDIANEVVLVDEKKSVSQNHLCDLQDAIALADSDTTLSLCHSTARLSDSQVVVLLRSSRVALQSPQATRTANGALARHFAQSIKQYTPKAKVLVAIPPATFLASLIHRILGSEAGQVIGLSSGIANAHLKRQIANRLDVSVKDVSTLIIGNDQTLYPLPQYCRVNGIPIAQLLSDEQICDIVKHVNQRYRRLNDAEVSYSLTVWISDIVTAIALDKKRVMNVGSLIQSSSSAVYLNMPAKIGSDGVEEVVPLDLTEEQCQQFTKLVALGMAEQG